MREWEAPAKRATAQKQSAAAHFCKPAAHGTEPEITKNSEPPSSTYFRFMRELAMPWPTRPQLMPARLYSPNLTMRHARRLPTVYCFMPCESSACVCAYVRKALTTMLARVHVCITHRRQIQHPHESILEPSQSSTSTHPHARTHACIGVLVPQ
eukprot:231598-Pelagomonas_calceolata.AAC.9